MNRNRPDPDDPASLRSRAEEIVRAGGTEAPETASAQDMARLLHELRVHQIELEMQNEELRRAQAELEISRERYFSLYDLAPVGYLSLSPEGMILEANLTAAGLLGVARGALAKRRFTSLIFSEDEDAYYLYRKRLLAPGAPPACDLRMLRHGGAPFWVRLEAAMVAAADGAPACRLVMSDITAQKEAEERLREAQKMESVGRLAGGVAHDLNNWLTVINGYSRLLLDQLGTEDPSAPPLAEICKAGEGAAALVRQLMAFGRKLVLQPCLLDVNRLVLDLQPLLAGLLGESVEVRIELDPEADRVLADPRQLEQVMINLALNARDAMPLGGELTIGTAMVEWGEGDARSHAEASAGRFVMLTVTDSGMGMSEETRRRVFEPFFTTKAVGKGTGLGLSTVQGIVAQSGGTVEVESEPGRGSAFRIYLPSVAEPRKEPCPPAEASMPRGGNETVLVVEDQAAVRDFVAEALRSCGYHVMAAAGGAAALSLCEQERGHIDLVLTDLVMPGMSGRELVNRLRASWPWMKVLFMSGYPSNTLQDHGIPEDAIGFLQKPFGLDALATTVRALLDRPAA